MSRIPLCVPYLGGNEARYLAQCVGSNFVSSVGPFVEQFEAAFAERVGVSNAIACCTGTAAIHLSLRALDVEPSADVMVSDLTFVASANPIAYEAATPVLVDSELSTWNLDPTLVADEIQRRVGAGEPLPVAIVVVHLLGVPADLGPIVEVAASHGIPVIEDAAEALGASWGHGTRAVSVGAAGTLGAFSFNGNKIITSGGGGMVVTDDPALASRVRHLSTQAKLPGRDYVHDEVGFNYRMTNLQAAVGLAQLEQLDDFLADKRRIERGYREALGGGPVQFLDSPHGQSSAWLSSMLADDLAAREALLDALDAEDIDARPIWRPLRSQAPFRNAPRVGGDVALGHGDRGLSLPCSVGLTDEQQQRVIDVVLAATARLP